MKVHARKKPLSEDASLSDIAKATAGFTGADLENLLNEAALLAARANQRFITMADLQESTSWRQWSGTRTSPSPAQ